MRASAAPPPPLPHRSHARPPSPALAGQASTDVNELKTCTLENPGSFVQLEALLLKYGVSAVRVGDSATLTGVTIANACDVEAAMAEVGAKATGLTTRGAFARQGVRAPPPCARYRRAAAASCSGGGRLHVARVRLGLRAARPLFLPASAPALPPPSRAANMCSKPGCECTAANPPAGCLCKGHVHKKSSAVAGAFHRVGGGGGRHGARVRSV